MLLRSFRSLLAAWRHGLRARPGWTLAAIALVVCCEVFGRMGTNDLADAAWMLAFAVFGVFVSAAHRKRPLAWWGIILGAWASLLASLPRLAIELGVDLRQDPPIERGWPARVVWSLIVGGALSVLLGVVGAFLPEGLRRLGTHSSFVLYLFVLFVLWSAAAVISIFGSHLVLNLARDLARSGRDDPDQPPLLHRQALSRLWVAACAVTIVAVPPVWAMGLVGICVAVRVAAWMVPGGPALPIVWRPRPGVEPRAFSWEGLQCCEIIFYAVVLLVFTLPLRGADLWGIPGAYRSMPISAFAGSFTLWAGAWLILGATVKLLHLSFLARFRNPARPCRPRLFLDGIEDSAVGRAIASSTAARGFRVVWGAGRSRRGDVRVRTVSSVDPWALEFALGLDALEDPETARRMARRNEVVQRRTLLRGLERVFKRAAAMSFQHGTGFFLAPHLWFESGLRRDARDEENERQDADSGSFDDHFGPSYALLMTRAARRHFYGVMRGVELDAIFIEDGVKWRRLRPVLKVLFKLYDVHEGRQPAADRHFSLLHGVHVVVHDFRLDEKPDLHGYPEPKYREISRARILHVFRDRGGEKDPVHDDSPSERVPLLV